MVKQNRLSEVIYQIYPSSFKDSSGDGHGDLNGITEKLDYVKSLNVDAIWISPFFKSPPGAKGDGGYAISDYREIDSRFGTMEDFENLLSEAHKKGLRVYTDFVMCHTADEHEWFKKSRDRKSGYKDHYVWSGGKKDTQGRLELVDGKPIPPNNWKSVFSGSAWTFNEKRGEFFLHHFNDSQPALNANSKKVQDAVLAEMKFWLDKGVDGLRLDALPFANYDPNLRNNPWMWEHDAWSAQYFEHSICQPQTIKYVSRIRELFDSYQKNGLGKKTAIGEAIAGKEGGLASIEVAASYSDAENGLDTCYTEMEFWEYPSAHALKAKLQESLKYFPDGGKCNVLSNHDFSRASTRMIPENCPQDLRSTLIRQLMAINFSLPGSVCMYQGEELGLPDARIPEDISYEERQDLLDSRCRDIARAPIPWKYKLKNSGFSKSSKPYLPMPESYTVRSVDLQETERYSMLNFTRNLISDRQNNPALQTGATTILNTDDPIFAFTRQTDEQTILSVFNMNQHTVEFKPSDHLDAETLEKINLSEDSVIIIDPYNFSRRGLIKSADTIPEISKDKLKNGHTGIKIFTAGLVLADVFNQMNDVSDIIEENGWKPSRRVRIDRETHQKLLKEENAHKEEITMGGSALTTMLTLKELQPDAHINIDYLGMVGHDKHGSILKDSFKKAGINLLSPQWPNNIAEETSVSHVIKTDGLDIMAIYTGTGCQALQEALQNDPNLLESSIARSDIVYLPGSVTQNFGQAFTDEILRLRWIHKKELILSLPIHAKYGPHDAQTFQNLIKSSNIVTGNDSEFCRIYGLDDVRPTTDSQMSIVTEKIQKAFKEDVLLNDCMPCRADPVAFITRGDLPALLVTKNKITEIPISKMKNAINPTGSGDAATAAFIDGILRELPCEDAARFAMEIGAEKACQKEKSRRLTNIHATQSKVLKKKKLQDIKSKYINAGYKK